MSGIDAKVSIKSALQSFKSGSPTERSLNLLKVLGYNTKRQSSLDKKTYQGFKDAYFGGNTRFSEEKALVSEWKYVDFLFQLSKDEITTQHGLFDIKQVDRTIIETYLFFVVELSKEHYSRTALSHITREINKIFPMPAMVLFKHGQALTLAVINRRMDKRDEGKDVLEKVTLIKDISIESPHRAHIEILFDLSFEEISRVHKFTNFVELHNAWRKTLDTKELNKKFYKELSNWYFWAMKEVDFPGAALHADKKSLFKEEDQEKEHNAKNLIRLLTRLLFVWFVKEKGLIPEELFDENYVSNELLLNLLLKKGTGASGNITSSYYRAILQNLFFATLNQTMGKREFRKPGQNMNVTNLMRYERYFKDSKKFIQLVERTVPFMNGGLFECLDRPDLEKKGKLGGDVIIYSDGFSDREDNVLAVPDHIFFGEDHTDLSEAYGDKAKEYKNVAVKGLVNILKSYKFTVAENTPLEEEVALDPELLGQVFENLLASYNPETKTTARKQTGSFYTPREIVNYMVDESLLAYLKQKLEDAGTKDKEDGLRDLISYSENPNPFNAWEAKLLIAAIDNCKILDPACGSGAFPMGILHKLAHVLHKLDPKNALWKQKQIEKAQTQDDVTIRDQLVNDIEEAFENNELDYGRKLYLIENCIYGVDIQPVATQISKLRFFISLIVDQKADTKKDNFGIRPLPNLETKFVAANTLIGIEKPKAQMDFGTEGVKAIEERLKDVRHRLFSAKTPGTKRKLREEDKDLREQMGVLLVKNGWKNETAKKLAGWDPYDQNTSSPFFDPEWMFGLTDGFDVVIGNPPYGHTISDNKEYFIKRYLSNEGKHEIFKYFIEKGLRLLAIKGTLTYITSDTWTSLGYFKKLRKIILTEFRLKAISRSLYNVFETATVDTNIYFISNDTPSASYLLLDGDLKSRRVKSLDINDDYVINLKEEDLLIKIIEKQNETIEDFCEVWQGLIAYGEKDQPRIYTSNKKETTSHRKLLYGGDIGKYKIGWSGEYLKYGKWLHRPRPSYIFDKPKILVQRIRNPQLEKRLICAIDNEGYLNGTGLSNILLKNGNKEPALNYLLCLLNSLLINYWFKFYFIDVNIKPEQIRKIPIKRSNREESFIRICTYVITLIKNDTKSSTFFERLIDAMVYELYFSAEIKFTDCEVLKYLNNLSEFKDDWSDEKKLAVIEKVYKELCDPSHPVSIAMAKMQEVPEVRIIEGRGKN